jgi:hypothetical protein
MSTSEQNFTTDLINCILYDHSTTTFISAVHKNFIHWHVTTYISQQLYMDGILYEHFATALMVAFSQHLTINLTNNLS